MVTQLRDSSPRDATAGTLLVTVALPWSGRPTGLVLTLQGKDVVATTEAAKQSAAHRKRSAAPRRVIERTHVTDTVLVRYIVNDVEAALTFYTAQLGFDVVMHPARTFAMVSRGALRLALSAPSGQGGGGQAMPDGRLPEPGGWNRISLPVVDIDSETARLRSAGVHFRNDIVTGIGGKQILLEDPSGNPIELFESTR